MPSDGQSPGRCNFPSEQIWWWVNTVAIGSERSLPAHLVPQGHSSEDAFLAWLCPLPKNSKERGGNSKGGAAVRTQSGEDSR